MFSIRQISTSRPDLNGVVVDVVVAVVVKLDQEAAQQRNVETQPRIENLRPEEEELGVQRVGRLLRPGPDHVGRTLRPDRPEQRRLATQADEKHLH